MPRRWFFNVPVMVMATVSLVAVSLAGLVLLLLPQTSEIIGVMQWRMVTAKSFSFDADADYRGTRGAPGAAVRAPEALAWKSSGRLLRQGSGAESDQRFRLTATGGEEPAVVAGELRAVGGDRFISVESAPDALGNLSFGALKGGWLRLDTGKIREVVDLPFLGGDGGGRDAGAAVADQIRRTPFFRFVRRLPSESISGTAVNHYLVEPEIIFFKDFVVRSEEARRGRELNEDERKVIDSFFADLTADQGELWIGAQDLYLRRLLLRFRYDDGIRNGVFTLTANFRDFNAVTEAVEAPAGPRDISAFVERLAPGIIAHLPLAKFGAPPRQLTPSANRGATVDAVVGESDSDGDGLSDAMEVFFGTDPRNPDTDGDGMSDGAEVDNGRNPNGPGRLFDFGLTK